MVTFTRFEELEDAKFFEAFVTEHYAKDGWSDVIGAPGVTLVLDKDRVRFAFETYHNNLAELRLKVDSANPDHFKRAACLLDALNRASPMKDLQYGDNLVSDLVTGMAFGLSKGDCDYRAEYVRYMWDYGNQIIAFDLAFRCCQTYERANRPYSPNYLENVAHYLSENEGKNVESLYMIFKTYWEKPED